MPFQYSRIGQVAMAGRSIVKACIAQAFLLLKKGKRMSEEIQITDAVYAASMPPVVDPVLDVSPQPVAQETATVAQEAVLVATVDATTNSVDSLAENASPAETAAAAALPNPVVVEPSVYDVVKRLISIQGTNLNAWDETVALAEKLVSDPTNVVQVLGKIAELLPLHKTV